MRRHFRLVQPVVDKTPRGTETLRRARYSGLPSALVVDRPEGTKRETAPSLAGAA